MFLIFFETIDAKERTSVLTVFNVGNAMATVAGSLLGWGLLVRWAKRSKPISHCSYFRHCAGRNSAYSWPACRACSSITSCRCLHGVECGPAVGSIDRPICRALPTRRGAAGRCRSAALGQPVENPSPALIRSLPAAVRAVVEWNSFRFHGIIPRSAMSHSLIVIPARLASTRLPRKLLLRETGKTLIQHTYEAACRARRPVGRVRRHRSRGDSSRGAALWRRRANDRPELPQRHRPRGRGRPAAARGRHLRQRARRRAGTVRRVDRPRGGIAGSRPDGRHVDLGHADSLHGEAARSGVREGRVRRSRPGDVLQPQPDSVRPAVGRRIAGRPAARISISTWGCTPIAASSCCGWRPCLPRRWRSSKSWSNSACWKPARRSSSASSTSPPSASTRRPTTAPSWPAPHHNTGNCADRYRGRLC